MVWDYFSVQGCEISLVRPRPSVSRLTVHLLLYLAYISRMSIAISGNRPWISTNITECCFPFPTFSPKMTVTVTIPAGWWFPLLLATISSRILGPPSAFRVLLTSDWAPIYQVDIFRFCVTLRCFYFNVVHRMSRS